MENLTKPELEMVLQIARLYKLSSVFNKKFKLHKTILDSVYPKMNASDRALIADTLEDGEARGSEDTEANKRDTVISNTLKHYCSAVDELVSDIDFSQRRSTDEEKAEQLKSDNGKS